MDNQPYSPGEVEVYAYFRKHLGPRMTSAGVGLQFHYNQTPGLHFKVDICKAYREAIEIEVQRSMYERFPRFPSTASIWVTRVHVDEIESSSFAFAHATRMAVEQAYLLRCPLRD